MFGSLLNTIQTTLLGSRGFLLTSVLPVLLFAAGSLWLDFDVQPQHRVWLAELTRDKPGLSVMAAALVLFAVSFVFSSLNTLLRELLEGKIYDLLPSVFRNGALRAQYKKADLAHRTFDTLQREHLEINKADWIKTLREARVAGAGNAPPMQAAVDALYSTVEPLTKKRRALRDLTTDEVKAAVDALVPVLSASTANDKGDANSKRLSDLHVDLVEGIRYVQSGVQRRRLDAYWQVAAFPEALAPTRLGNIAGTLRSFGESRYGFAVEIFWTRLQSVIQSDDKTFNTIQDAKIQLDFFVSLTCLTVLFTTTWTVILGAASANLRLFLLVVIGGPLLARLWYSLACQMYVVFADAMRSAIDLLRFKLIQSYHLPLPAGSNDERQLWQDLAARVGYDSPKGDTVFKHT
jgi:hypothetical protein